MSDRRNTGTESKSGTRKEWVRPELKQIDIEKITGTSPGAHYDGTAARS
jgi:hypothetical protein